MTEHYGNKNLNNTNIGRRILRSLSVFETLKMKRRITVIDAKKFNLEKEFVRKNLRLDNKYAKKKINK